MSFLKRFYLFIFRARGREGEREGEKHQCVVASHMPRMWDLANNPGMCPDWYSNQQPFGSQARTQMSFSQKQTKRSMKSSYVNIRDPDNQNQHEKEQSRRIHTSQFKTYYKATRTKTVALRKKDMQIRRTELESRNKPSRLWSTDCDKDAKTIQ